jgi:transcriptional regulator with XRE-family HTH domain
MTTVAVRRFSGDNLRRIRREQGISTEHIARAVGRSVFTVQNYETGRYAPPGDVIGRIAALLRCPVDLLYGPVEVAERPEWPVGA